ncbi:MAG: NFACT family protein [Spirochaetales bacterium]|nr:NFACT family protein [Spirochaetales bacterium]
MSLNWKEIDRAAGEWNLVPSFLQEIRQPDFQHLLFQFYTRGGGTDLLISLNPGALRIHKTRKKRKALPKPPRFTTFLKARLKGAKVTALEQIGSERIIRFDLTRGGETFYLYVKLWENSANIIVTDGNHRILDCFTRRPGKGEAPGKSYDPRELLDASPSADPDRFPVRDFPGQGDYNERMELFYEDREEDSDLDKLRREADQCLRKEKRRLENRQEKLERTLKEYGQAQKYREWGDLIMSHLTQINEGDRNLELSLTDGKGNEETLLLELDPQLSPSRNGERYYKRYKKARTGEKLAREEWASLETRLKLLNEEREHLDEENDRKKLVELITLEKQRKTKNDSPTPGLQFHSGPFLLLVGRNSSENDELLRHYVNGNDLWLHNRDWPGGYVFIKKLKGKSVPLETLLDAGTLALHYSRGKKAGKGDLYYTEVKYLRRAKGAPRGTVLPTREKNLTVELDPARLARLIGS